MLDGNRRFIPAGAAVLLPWGQDENPTLKAPGAGFQYVQMGDGDSGVFWENQGAQVWRINDRLLVGGATDNDADKPNAVKDWLSELVNWPVYNATAAITSRFGTIALTTGSQTVDLDPDAAGTVQTTIGVTAFAMANNPGTFPDAFFSAYGFYGEGRVYPGTVSNAFAAELEAINMHSAGVGAPTPYRELLLSATQALRLGSGGGQDLVVYDALSAIGIVPNGAKFHAGIVFEKGAITGTDGVTGFGEAIMFAKGHLLAWYAAGGGSGVRTAFITSTVDDEDYATSLQAQNNAWLFLGPSGEISFAVGNAPGTVNGLGVVPATTGSAPYVEAIGDDPAVSLGLRAKGAAYVVPYSSIRPDSTVAGEALGLIANSQSIIWRNGPGNQSAAILSDRTVATAMILDFVDNGVVFYSASGAGSTQFSVLEVPSALNYPEMFGGVTGSAAGVQAQGTGTNKNLALLARDATGQFELRCATQGAALNGAGGAMPANAEKFLKVTVTDGGGTANYVIPLLRAS